MIHRIYLQEMPWLKYYNKFFDLELENLEDNWEMIDFIVGIFNGRKIKDKHGNIIHLKTAEDMENFYSELKNNSSFLLYVKNHFSKVEQESLDIGIWNAFRVMRKHFEPKI